MRTRTISRTAIIPLAVIAGLALLLIVTSPLSSKPASAQIVPASAGDGTVIFGGLASGSNAAVSVAVAANVNYVVSATVPGGGNFYGAVLEITYDPTKATPTCPEETVSGSIRVYCNDGYPGNKVRIVIESSTVVGQDIVGMTGTNALVTIQWTGVAATANAISSMAIVGSCINGAGESLNPCMAQAGAVTVTGGSGGIVGDITCDGNVNIFDVTRLSGIILSKPGVNPGPCGPRLDLTCDGNVNIFDVTRLSGFILTKPGVTIPATCPI